MSPGWPNGETRPSEMAVTPFEESKPRELKHLSTSWKEKSKEMPQVAASERGPSPNRYSLWVPGL